MASQPTTSDGTEPFCNILVHGRLEEKLAALTSVVLKMDADHQKLVARAIVEDAEMKLLVLFSGMSRQALENMGIRGGIKNAEEVLEDPAEEMSEHTRHNIIGAIADATRVANDIVPLAVRMAVRRAATIPAHPPNIASLDADQIDALVSDTGFPEALHGAAEVANVKMVAKLRHHANHLMVCKRSAEASRRDARADVLKQHSAVIAAQLRAEAAAAVPQRLPLARATGAQAASLSTSESAPPTGTTVAAVLTQPEGSMPSAELAAPFILHVAPQADVGEAVPVTQDIGERVHAAHVAGQPEQRRPNASQRKRAARLRSRAAALAASASASAAAAAATVTAARDEVFDLDAVD